MSKRVDQIPPLFVFYLDDKPDKLTCDFYEGRHPEKFQTGGWVAFHWEEFFPAHGKIIAVVDKWKYVFSRDNTLLDTRCTRRLGWTDDRCNRLISDKWRHDGQRHTISQQYCSEHWR